MKTTAVISLLASPWALHAQAPQAAARADWLLDGTSYTARVETSVPAQEIVLTNGLVRRVIRLEPDACTVALDNLMTGASILRAVRPEASLVIDGAPYPVGGLDGQEEQAYLLNEWVDDFTASPGAFHYAGYRVGKTQAPFGWMRKRHSENRPWPPPGVALELDFAAPAGASHAALRGLSVTVHYELYDGIPLFAKWFSFENGSDEPVRLDRFTADLLAAVEAGSDVENPFRWEHPNLHVETDYAFGGFSPRSAVQVARWEPDPAYTSQVNYARQTPCLMVVAPPVGPGVLIAPGGVFETFRTYQLIHDSTDRERRGLAQRRMYRTVAPWATENPILMHVRSADPEAVRLAVDQCAEVGFEMVILTFGSGFDIENEDPEYIAQMKSLVDYAHSKGIELGGYSLLSSRRIGDEHDVIDAATGKPGGAKFGNAPCLGSEWGIEYFRKLYAFFEATGFDLLEHDGSYPGDTCGSTSHPGHADHADSQWRQWRTIRDYYRWCRERGVYLNVPDWYFLAGSSKIGMGYRETNWSLPRERQVVLGRQNIYDGTWFKTPSMGWMFVPLVEYHGGGEAATLEPLSEHLDAYGQHLANNFGAGVQACYRGPRLYDTDETKALVKGWVDFYKSHRAILESDVIHIRRADGRDLDALLHVNPNLEERGLLSVWNPTGRTIEKTLEVPVYYTGLKGKATVRRGDGERRLTAVGRDDTLRLDVEVEPGGYAWYVIEAPQ